MFLADLVGLERVVGAGCAGEDIMIGELRGGEEGIVAGARGDGHGGCEVGGEGEGQDGSRGEVSSEFTRVETRERCGEISWNYAREAC